MVSEEHTEEGEEEEEKSREEQRVTALLIAIFCVPKMKARKNRIWKKFD